MKKKYGYGWENQVDGTDEDCPTAYELRLEWEREDEYQHSQSQLAIALLEQEYDRDEHEDALFDVRMELETSGMTPSVKRSYIQEKQLAHLGKRWEHALDDAFYNDGQQFYRAIELAAADKDSKK